MGRASKPDAPIDDTLRLKRRTDGVTALGRALHWQRALDLVIQESAPDIFLFNAGIASLGRASRRTQALWLLREASVRSLRRDVVSFNAASAAILRSGEWKAALSMQRQRDLLGTCPDVVSANTAMAAFGEVGRWPAALQAFVHMASGQSPSIISLTSFVDVCKAGEEWRSCLDFISHAMALTHVVLNIYLVNVLTATLGIVARWRAAMGYAEQLGCGLRRDLISMNAQLSAMEVAGRWESALALSWEARQRSFAPSLPAENSGIKACVHHHKWWVACTLLVRFERLRLRADIISFSAAAHVLGQSIEWLRALAVLHSSLEAMIELDSIILRTAISACEISIEGAQWARASSLFQKMRPLMLEQESVAFNSVLSACEKGQRWQPSLGLLTSLASSAVARGQLAFKAVAASMDPNQWRRSLCLCPEEADAVTREAVITNCEAASASAPIPRLLAGLSVRGLHAVN